MITLSKNIIVYHLSIFPKDSRNNFNNWRSLYIHGWHTFSDDNKIKWWWLSLSHFIPEVKIYTHHHTQIVHSYLRRVKGIFVSGTKDDYELNF